MFSIVLRPIFQNYYHANEFCKNETNAKGKYKDFILRLEILNFTMAKVGKQRIPRFTL